MLLFSRMQAKRRRSLFLFLVGLMLGSAAAHAESGLSGQGGKAHAKLNFQVVIPPRLTLDVLASPSSAAAANARANQGNAMLLKARDTQVQGQGAWMYTAWVL